MAWDTMGPPAGDELPASGKWEVTTRDEVGAVFTQQGSRSFVVASYTGLRSWLGRHKGRRVSVITPAGDLYEMRRAEHGGGWTRQGF